MSRRPPLLASDLVFMREALRCAGATPAGDVPVGAVLVRAGVVVGRGCNRREAEGDPTAHAEMIAVREAAGVVGDGWRVEGATAYVTLEPCAMCVGALLSARVSRIVFGAYERKTGACGSWIDIPREPGGVFHAEVVGGVLEEECAALLKDFFATVRGSGAQKQGG